MSITDTARILGTALGRTVSEALGTTKEQRELFGLAYNLQLLRDELAKAKNAEEVLATLKRESQRLATNYASSKKTNESDPKLDTIAAAFVDNKAKIGEQLDFLADARSRAQIARDALDGSVALVALAPQELTAEQTALLASARATSTEANDILRHVLKVVEQSNVHSDEIAQNLQKARDRMTAAQSQMPATPAAPATASSPTAASSPVLEQNRKRIESELDAMLADIPPLDPQPKAEETPPAAPTK